MIQDDRTRRSTREEMALSPVSSLHGCGAIVHSQKVPVSISQDESDEFINQHKCENDHIHQLWSPLFLRRKVLAFFIVSFTAMIAALAALHIYCDRNQGLSTVNPKQHYLWTYGPSAVLTIFAPSWGQIEYRSKQLMPWRAMAKASTPTHHSLLLDYISPWNVQSLIRSLRASHFMVALAIAGSLLINLLTVFSTGLFMPQITFVTHNSTQLVALSKFDSSRFTSDAADGRPFTTIQAFNATLEGMVDVFSADLKCEEPLAMYIDWPGRENIEQTPQDITAVTQTCNITVQVDVPDQPLVLRSLARAGLCGQEPDWRLIGLMAYIDEDTYPAQFYNFTGLICTPQYSISRGLVSLRGAGADVAVNVSTPAGSKSWTIDDVGANDILETLYYASVLSMGSTSTQVSESLRHVDSLDAPLMEIFNLTFPVSDFSQYMNADVLEVAAQRAFTAVAAQIAKIYLMTATEEAFIGTTFSNETRLWVRPLSLALMSTILAVLVIIAVAIGLFYAPCAVCSRDPGSIGGLATIIARSQKIVGALQRMGASELSALHRVLSGLHYRTFAEHPSGASTFEVIQLGTAAKGQSMGTSADDKVKWWQPFAVSAAARCLVLILPLALIAVLEVLYQHSQRSDGITDVKSQGPLRYTWVYIPALTMLCVKICYEMVHFGVCVFQPFHNLRKGTAPAQISIMETQFAKIPVHRLLDAIWKRQYVIVASTTAVLFAPLLTVSVSGLYTAQNVPVQRPVTVQQLKTFNQSAPLSMDDYGNRVAGLIMSNNLSFPLWTHEELAFPIMNVSPEALVNDTSGDGTILDARVAAIRGVLNCTTVPTQFFTSSLPDDNIIGGPYRYLAGKRMVRFEYNLPNCLSNATLYHLSAVPETGGYFGRLAAISNFQFPGEPLSICPRIVLTYGRVAGEEDVIEHATMLQCYPYLEELDVHTTFSVPGYAIDTSHPPEPDEGSIKVIQDISGPEYWINNFQTVNVSSETSRLDPFLQAVIHGVDGIPAEEWLGSANEQRLIDGANHNFALAVAQYLNSHNRQDAPADAQVFNGTLFNPHPVRLVQSAISTRILQGILAVMFLCAAFTFASMRTGRVLPKNPCSIAAVASMLAGSTMLSEVIIPPGSEWCDDKELRKRGVFDGYRFTLGWWDQEDTDERRFGIDIDEGTVFEKERKR